MSQWWEKEYVRDLFIIISYLLYQRFNSLFFGIIAFELYDLDQTFRLSFHKFPTIVFWNYGSMTESAGTESRF